MGSTLVINSSPTEVRVALLDDGTPVELHVERRADRGVVGNIYRGRVVRVLPGMQAAFVDIGIERTAFLYVNDALPRPITVDEPEPEVADGATEAPEPNGTPGRGPNGESRPGRGFRQAPAANIADVLKHGQDVLVQVQKEPLGQKGARVTRHVTLPGRHLVLMPFSDHIGVSHRITDDAERERLRAVLADGKPEGVGYIVRTAAEGLDEGTLKSEAQLLVRTWTDIEKRGSTGPAPRLVFEDFDLVLRAVRDFFTVNVEKMVCDDPGDHARVLETMRTMNPDGATRVELYEGRVPIFDEYGIEVALERALDRRVWLKSGGYIVIDQAEALTAIDVNSGRFVGKSSLEDTITQINLEAVKEIAYQLRLRNIGGIIIIDFIDMAAAENREKVLTALADALARDKAKSIIVRMSEIGLVEMTRKRVRDSLGHVLTEDCPYCKARGFVKSEQTVANEILRAIARTLASSPAARVLVNTSAAVVDHLYEAETAEIERIERVYQTMIIPVAREGFHREQYEIVPATG